MGVTDFIPPLTDADREWLRGMVQIDSPVPERSLDPRRVRRLTTDRLIDRRWCPREGYVVFLTARGRRAVES